MHSLLDEPIPETAKCGICKSVLEFGVGFYGQSVEKCSNRKCLNHHPHRPIPDSIAPKRALKGEGPVGMAQRNRRRGIED